MKVPILVFLLFFIATNALLVSSAYADEIQRITTVVDGNITQIIIPGLVPDTSNSNTSSASEKVHSYAILNANIMSSENSVSPRPGIEWQRIVGSSADDEFASIRQTSDGGYIAGGMTYTYKADGDVTRAIGNGDGWVVKMNASGTIEWQNVYGGRGRDEFRSIRPTKDGGYVMVGFSNSVDGDFAGKNLGGYDIFVVKTDSNGNKTWQQELGGTNDDVGTGIRQTIDGGYIVTGYEDYSHSGKISQFSDMTNAWVFKLRADGSVEWQKKLGGSGGNQGTSIVQTSDGGYAMYGFTSSSNSGDVGQNHGDHDLWLVRMDSLGNMLWNKLYGGSGFESTGNVYDDGIQVTPDEGFVLVGQTTSDMSGDVGTTHGSGDIWILKLDGSGGIQWQKTFGGTDYDLGTSVELAPDGGYVVSGITRSTNSGDVGSNNGDFDFWVVRTDSSGKLLWQDVLGGSGYEQAANVVPTSNDGYIVTGKTESNNSGDVRLNHGYTDAWVVKLSPRLVVDVIDSDTNTWVPNTQVTLHDEIHNEDQSQTTAINGHIVFTDSGTSHEFKLVPGNKYTIKASADKYSDSPIDDLTFEHDGQLEILHQKPLVKAYDNSFSITCIENYDHIGPIHGSFDECNNMAADLIKAGYKMNFYHKDDEVKREDFHINSFYSGPTIDDSAFHYHSGHGGDAGKASLPFNQSLPNITALLLKGYSNPLDVGNFIISGSVYKEWGGKNKWIMLDSCNILHDESWHDALSTSHGILGFYTQSAVNQTFPHTFLNYAFNNSYTIVDAFKQTTLDTYHDPSFIAAVITKTHDQYLYDHFPGTGYLAADNLSDTYFIRHWECLHGVGW